MQSDTVMPRHRHLINAWPVWMSYNCSANPSRQQGVHMLFFPSIIYVGSWLAWTSCAWPWWAQERRVCALRVTYSRARTCSHRQCYSRSPRTWAERGFTKSVSDIMTTVCPSTAACTGTSGEWSLVLSQYVFRHWWTERANYARISDLFLCCKINSHIMTFMVFPLYFLYIF